MRGATMAVERARGSWIPWLFVGFFLLVVAVNGVMVYVATVSWTGLETQSSYDKGLQYNRNLEAAARQAELGWTPTFEARIVQGYLAEVELRVTDARNEPVDGADVLAVFERPGEQAADFELPLLAAGPGLYRARFDLPRVGVWKIHLTVRRGEDVYVRDEQVMLR